MHMLRAASAVIGLTVVSCAPPSDPAPVPVIAYLASAGPLDGHEADLRPAEIAVFSDGIVLARDRDVLPGDDRSPAYRRVTLPAGELATLREAIDGVALSLLPSPAPMARTDAPELVIGFDDDGARGEVRGGEPFGELGDATRALLHLRWVAEEVGEPIQPDAAHPLPEMRSGPMLGG